MILYLSNCKNQTEKTLKKLINLIYVLLYLHKTKYLHKVVKLLNYFNKIMLYFFSKTVNVAVSGIFNNDNLFNFFLLKKKFKYQYLNKNLVYFFLKKHYYTKNITQFLQQLFFNSYFNVNLNSKIFAISYNLH